MYTCVYIYIYIKENILNYYKYRQVSSFNSYNKSLKVEQYFKRFLVLHVPYMPVCIQYLFHFLKVYSTFPKKRVKTILP